MVGKLEGRTAVVTGAGEGIGVAVARAFLRQGARVVVSRRDQPAVDRVLALLDGEGPVEGVVADISVRADAERTIASAVDRFGRLDVLVNNGQAKLPETLRNLEDFDAAAVDLYIRSGLMGSLYHMQAAFPHLKARGGSIINFGSREGVVGGVGFAAYAAAKEGIRGLSRVAAREWGRHAIRVNVVCPAALSPRAAKYLDANPDKVEIYRDALALGRFGDPFEDIAPAVLFLACDDSAYVTGQTLNVDGGQVML